MTAADMEPSWNRVGRNDTASIHEAADKHCEVCLPPHRVLRHGVMICRCNVGILPMPICALLVQISAVLFSI